MAESELQNNQEIQEQQESQEKQQNEPSFSLKTLLFDLFDIAEAVCISVFVMILIFAYLLRPVTVDGSSMNPTLYDADKLIMWSLGYTPQIGDIVIIDDDKAGHFTDATQQSVEITDGMGIRLVKRVIAVGGQTIDINFDTGEVTRDGVVLDEPYIAELTKRDDYAFTYPITIPEGYVFVMGDNRMHSSDSRNPLVALVPEEQVIGHAVVRFSREDDLCTSWKDNFGVLTK